MKKNVVVIGGGNGGAKAIRACKRFIDDIELSAVIAMSDDGGSTGTLRKEFNTLPPGDVLRAAMAMSVHDYELLKSIFYTPRFDVGGKLNKHDLGNLFLVLGAEYAGDYMSAIRALEQALGAVGQVYPVTLDKTTLVAEHASGKVVVGERAIDTNPDDRSDRITKVWLDPSGVLYGEARKKIEAADYIVLSPGSLYTSIVATIVVDGFKEALAASKAKTIYVSGNAFQGRGELGPTKLSEIVQELESYLPRKLDVILYNNAALNSEQLQWYKEKHWELFDVDIEMIVDRDIIQKNYERDGRPGLDEQKLGVHLKDIILN